MIRPLHLFGFKPALWAASVALLPATASAELHVLIVEGLGGDSQYAQEFHETQQSLQKAAQSLTGAHSIVSLTGEAATRDRIVASLRSLAKNLRAEDRLAVYLVGHGSYDGYFYKFNIPGADMTGEELSKLLDAIPAKNQLVIATGSASGALADLLKRDARVVITATRSGSERNATRFGVEFTAALRDPATDLDKNGSVSAQEAFDAASRKVKDYFEREKRLASEHARLEGATAARFTVAQLHGAAPALSDNPAVDGLQQQRKQLQERIEELRLRKDSLGEKEYLAQFEKLALELAEVEDKLESAAGGEARER